tara:strand:- start:1527 stop:2606 length:1080 start_codon:yes stop_codon:yes gene_type:complete
MDDLTEISEKFDEVKNIRNKINISFGEIDAKIASLKLIYKDVSDKHTQPECTLGVDSLYFQNELITREFNNLKQLFDFINNRIYCEYYKLNSMIQTYIKKELRSQELIKQTKTETVYPAYKSLEPLKEYDFSLVNQLFNQICDLITKMHSHTKNQDDNLIVDQGRMQMGLNIDNVIHSQKYVNKILKEKGIMFKSYLTAFQRHHLKYLNRLDAKVALVLSIIHDDIALGANKNESQRKKSENHRSETTDNASTDTPTSNTTNTDQAKPNTTKSDDPPQNNNTSETRVPTEETTVGNKKSVESDENMEASKTASETSITSDEIVKNLVDDVINGVISNYEQDNTSENKVKKNNIEVIIKE